MTVRLKISLLITLTGFGASLVFSCFILQEMLEQPFRIMDSDLAAMARRAVHIVSDKDIRQNIPLLIGDKRYWLEVYEQDAGSPVYTSDLARLIKIPEPAPGTGVTISLNVPREKIDPGRKGKGEVTFRVRREQIVFNGKSFLVTVGRPMERLEEEIRETYVGTAGGLAFSVLLLMISSYFVAGLILKPVKIMGDQARDISEKHLERRIPVTGQRDEFNALARTLNQVFNQLQHAFLQQKQFLADASHELKTPLTLMRLSVDEMRSLNEENPSCPQSPEILRMTEQVLRMERLVKNLLNLSSLELEDSLGKDAVDVTKVLTALLVDYRFLAETRNIRIEDTLAPGLFTRGDEERLNRAFSNILDNAVKYNVDGGWVEVRAAQSEEAIEVTVTNSGPGVGTSKIPKVFDRFSRVEESRSLRYGGSGLGLAIVKRIVELHEGTVRFESRLHDWTRLTINLPRNKETTPV